MKITVYRTDSSDEYAGADNFNADFDSGYLHVTKGEDVLAVYAPGVWKWLAIDHDEPQP